MAITLKKARRTSIATAVLWAMGLGVAMADPPTGNKLVGPVVNATSNATTVNILQVGKGNVISGIGNDAGDSAGAKATINSTGTHAITLTIQQVGAATGGNILTLAAKTAGNAPNEIKIFQGASKETNDPADNDTPPVTIGSPNAVTGNTAKITLGNASGGIQGSTVIVSQQSNNNTAIINFGTDTKIAAPKGSLTLVQTGIAGDGVGTGGNTATLTIDGTFSRTYQIAQNGASNTLLLDADGIGAGGVTIKFGTVNFDNKLTWLAGAGTSSNYNNADNFDHFGVGTKPGINLGTIAGFDLSVTGNYNGIQVDLSNADPSSSISGLTFDGNGTSPSDFRKLAIFGGGGLATVSISAVDVNNSDLIVNAGAGAGKITLSSLTLNGNSTFTSTGGTVNLSSLTSSGTLTVDAGASGNITLSGLTLTGNSTFTSTGGTVNLSSLTSSGTLTVDAGASGTLTLSGLTLTADSTFSTNSAVGSDFTFSLAAGKVATANVGLNTFSLTNSGDGTVTSATVVQKGDGAKKFSMTNQTDGATINVTQDGAGAHTATGINFLAGKNSTFTLVQR